MKFARNVHFQIADGKEKEFNRIFESEVMPLLKQQNGFRDELTLISKDQALGISIWDDRNSAELYQNGMYPKIVQKLTPVLRGTPSVEMYEVGLTTIGA